MLRIFQRLEIRRRNCLLLGLATRYDAGIVVRMWRGATRFNPGTLTNNGGALGRMLLSHNSTCRGQLTFKQRFQLLSICPHFPATSTLFRLKLFHVLSSSTDGSVLKVIANGYLVRLGFSLEYHVRIFVFLPLFLDSHSR